MARLFCKSLASLFFELCGKREMLGFLRKSGEHKGRGIYFIFTIPVRPLVPSLLEEFH